MAVHHTTPDMNGVTHFGTPEIGYHEANCPEQRTDIPPMQRVGMPLYNPDAYAEPTQDETVVDGEVVESRLSLDGSTDDDGKAVAVRK